jgi:hypothetical protein
MSNSEYNVLLFGDFEPEIVRLSKLFDPERDEFQLVTSNEFNPDWIYYTAEVRNKTLYFSRASEEDVRAAAEAGTLANNYWHGPDHDVDEDGENGKYVPAVKSIVVVDPEASNIDYGRWGTYTLLIVDSVDPVTFKSTLVPINFTGDIDNATRAVDYQNDKLMLYFDTVEVLGGKKVTALTPDRKLMMYGQTALKYRILKGSEVISTNEFTATGVSATPKFIKYRSAAASRFQITENNYEQLLGKYVEYYDASETRKRVLVGTTNIEHIKSLKVVDVLGTTDATLNNVQVPDHCYLKLNAAAPIEGDVYVFEVYEDDIAREELKDENGNVVGHREVGVNRLVLSVKLTAKAATPLDGLDDSNAVVTGFGVNYLNDEGEMETGDVWSVGYGSTKENIISRIDPYLELEDGTIKHIPMTAIDATMFVYGLEQMKETTSVGIEFDVLFKYFPNIARNVESVNRNDLLYVEAATSKVVTDVEGKESTIKLTPSPLKQYFKLEDGVMKSVGYGDELGSFVDGEIYYTKRPDLDWTKVVVGPTKDFINCHKRIRVVSTIASDPRFIIPVPTERNGGKYPYEEPASNYDINYLVYDNRYNSPLLISGTDPRIGFISDGEIKFGDAANGVRPSGEDTEFGKIQKCTVKYRVSESAPWKTFSQPIAIKLESFITDAVTEKWLIGKTDVDTAFGRDDSSSGKVRPYVCYDSRHAEYFIDPLAFRNKAEFLASFYYPLVGTDAVEPTHFRIRDLSVGKTPDTAPINGPITLVDNPSSSISPFHTHFSKGSSLSLQPVVEAGSAIEEDRYKVIGTTLVEFINLTNGVQQYLAAAPVEIRLYNSSEDA